MCLKSPAANASFARSNRLAPVGVLEPLRSVDPVDDPASEEADVAPAEPDVDEVAAAADVRVVTPLLGDVDEESALLPHAVTATAPTVASTRSTPDRCFISATSPSTQPVALRRQRPRGQACAALRTADTQKTRGPTVSAAAGESPASQLGRSSVSRSLGALGATVTPIFVGRSSRRQLPHRRALTSRAPGAGDHRSPRAADRMPPQTGHDGTVDDTGRSRILQGRDAARR